MADYDFGIESYGSVVLVSPKTDEAKAHLEEHVSPEAIWWHGALAVEPRYLEALLGNLHEDGFTWR